MRMFVAPPDTRPRPVHPDVRDALRHRDTREVFRDWFALTPVRAEFLTALYARREGLNRTQIVHATGMSRETVLSAYVRTRDLGVETDGVVFTMGAALRARCAEALSSDLIRP